MDAERPRIARRVRIPSPEWDIASDAIKRAMRLTAELNKLSFDDLAKVREIFSELTGRKVDDAFTLIPPFYSAYGLDLRVGRRVSINQCCTIYDMGGVDIADKVMIGPNVNIITTGHALAPFERRAYVEAKPIVNRKERLDRDRRHNNRRRYRGRKFRRRSGRRGDEGCSCQQPGGRRAGESHTVARGRLAGRGLRLASGWGDFPDGRNRPK